MKWSPKNPKYGSLKSNLLSLDKKCIGELGLNCGEGRRGRNETLLSKISAVQNAQLSFLSKPHYLQNLSNQLSKNKTKHMHGIFGSRSFKWGIESQYPMLHCWKNANQSFDGQNPGLRIFPKILSKTLIFLKLRGGGKFTPWFCDVLGPTQHLISKSKNGTPNLSILKLDLLLKLFEFRNTLVWKIFEWKSHF